jgi:hypothetical protein
VRIAEVSLAKMAHQEAVQVRDTKVHHLLHRRPISAIIIVIVVAGASALLLVVEVATNC